MAEAGASFDTSFLSLPSPSGDFVQYVYMTPVINDVRFGKWDAILNRPEAPPRYTYANILWHWARGVAMAKKNNIPNARVELKYIHEKKNQPGMLVVMQPFNAPADAVKVAENILAGIIAQQQDDLPAAVLLLEEAVKNEDAMIYNEPKDWLLPARAYLGAAY